MFYYAWILGLPLAVFFATLMGVWYELKEDSAKKG